MSDLDLFSELFYSVYGLALFNEDHCDEDYLSFEEADDIADRKRREIKASRRYREELFGRDEAETEGEAEIEAV